MNGDAFLTHVEFIEKYNMNINFLTYNGTIRAVKNYRSKLKIAVSTTKKKCNYQPPINIIMCTKKGSSLIYSNIIRTSDIPKGILKWQQTTTLNMTHAFNVLKKTTSDSKLRWFQLRILHNILTTNRSASKFIPNQSDLCQFCKSKSETISHLLWECKKVQQFWKDLATLINKRAVHANNIKFHMSLVIFGLSESIETDCVFNYIILIAKYYIYRCKVQLIELSINRFHHELYFKYCIERHIHNNSLDFRIRWNPYLNLFKSLLPSGN